MNEHLSVHGQRLSLWPNFKSGPQSAQPWSPHPVFGLTSPVLARILLCKVRENLYPWYLITALYPNLYYLSPWPVVSKNPPSYDSPLSNFPSTNPLTLAVNSLLALLPFLCLELSSIFHTYCNSLDFWLRLVTCGISVSQPETEPRPQ